MDHPTVGVVVVNYNGGELTVACLRSLLGSLWPAAQLRLVLVDNASSDDVVARVRAELPEVEVLENTENVGFGAACNRGIRALADVDHLALVNNDATVDPEWLRPLVDALDADPGVGAACPKILFAGGYREVELRTATTRRGRGDARDLGVLLAGARVDGVDAWRRVHLVDGTWGVEPGLVDGAAWTGAVAHLQLPASDEPGASTSLLLSADAPREVELHAGDGAAMHSVGPEPAWYDVPSGGPTIRVVNNAGTELAPGGFGVDRGFQEPDDGRFDHPVDVFAWCGAAVLLRAEYLDDVGLFDEGLFLYYEDLELAWRGSKRGWRYRYVPTSIVHHVHTASSVNGSAFKRYFDERNRLLVLSRHGSVADTARAIGRSLLVTASYTRRDVVAPVLAGESPHPEIVRDRLRAWGGFARRFPGALTRRRRDRTADAR